MRESRVTVADRPTALAMDVIAFGRERRMTFRPLPYCGVPEEPFADNEFVYRLARQMPSDFEMPTGVWRRFFEVYESNIPIKDVAIAEEIEPYREWQKTIEAGKTAAKATGVVAGAVGVGLLSILAMVPMALMADPKLIIILDSPDQEWISIAEWV